MTHTTSYSDTSTRELRHVLAWADQNNLKLNFSKSKEIKFTSCGMRSKSVTIPSPCMWQVTCITVHDVMLNDKPSAADQLPCDHWLSVSSLQDVFQQTVLASITYCVPFVWAFAQPIIVHDWMHCCDAASITDTVPITFRWLGTTHLFGNWSA